ncbi:AAA family ATPase [uncultured Fibrobacter sp.]|uniref:AAA family ATPase n=1 Tax=uncultured Fibrobacter sp. TaxID=261512 RepID=UPI0025E08DCF|nr:AAA family ATPase [uncultured Fibrobacter sp.]
MSDYADWQGIDRGHEGYWERSVWMGVLKVLNDCGGSADFLNENSIIYTELDSKIPQVEWHSIEGNGAWRSNFRDAREPWSGTGVISFDDTRMRLTEKGRQILSGQKSFDEIICDALKSYSENNENPFAILAKVFLSLPINQGLSFDDAVKIMRHYRPNIDDLQNVILNDAEEISVTAKRRLRHILRLLTFTGGVVFDSNIYYVASRRVLCGLLPLQSLTQEEIKEQFILWLTNNCRGSESFRDDMVKIIESWLDQKMPNDNIGNLFRFSKTSEYEQEKARITNLPLFESVNRGNQNGRPKTALNHYTNFLAYLNSLEGGQESSESASNNPSRPFTPSQIIYYGVPGCGKSNKIREQLKDVPEKNKVRVVFHPEYTNAEFIGQILPKVNGHVTYEFTPGPFTQIIKRAYLSPNEHFYLVIEEINRGNAAAIFGDTFQLLDRLKAGETDSLGNDPANASVNTFTEGWSQYFVQNDDINAYIRKAIIQDDGSYQERNDGEPIEEIKIKDIHFNANTAIRLPPNLSIWATMNTSDQNVFTLDNAFQRRFDMELVRNEFDLNKPAVNAQYNAEIDDTGIKWGQFWGWINAKITATLKGLSSTEDKRLGVWFVSNVDGIIDDKIFAEKVLKFLWDDVFKFKRPQIFAKDVDTLEKLINFFENPPEGKERFDVFDGKADLKAFEASPTL